MKKGESSFEARHKEKPTQCWKDLIGEVKKDPWGLAVIIVTKKLVTRRKTPGLDNLEKTSMLCETCFDT